MKNKHQYLAFLLCAVASFAFIAGCKYDIAEPMWDRPYTAPVTPKINSVNPASIAKAGDNYIRIFGENLAQGDDSTEVYFGSNPVDVLYMSKDTIIIRRPGLVIDSCTIKVVPRKALVEAKYGPYQITQVIEQYGNFLEKDHGLNSLVIDDAENLYVFDSLKAV
ncbi:MAG: IPT/TIG domain-containing protein, partial [Ignavibacteria bacterium]|nr:IPT/TIG domain-containing protein [Ignavibacteria bacterium]